MAVYFEPRRDPWYAGLIGLGLSKALEGMFARDAEARQVNQFRKQAAKALDILQPHPAPETPDYDFGNGALGQAYKGIRDAVRDAGWGEAWGNGGGLTADNYARAGAQFSRANQQAGLGLLKSAYGDKLAALADLEKADAINSRIGAMPTDGRRKSWARYLANVGIYNPQAVGPMQKGLDWAFPNQQFDSLNTGGSQLVYSKDPVTGKVIQQFSAKNSYSPSDLTSMRNTDARISGALRLQEAKGRHESELDAVKRKWEAEQAELNRKLRQEIANGGLDFKTAKARYDAGLSDDIGPFAKNGSDAVLAEITTVMPRTLDEAMEQLAGGDPEQQKKVAQEVSTLRKEGETDEEIFSYLKRYFK